MKFAEPSLRKPSAKAPPAQAAARVEPMPVSLTTAQRARQLQRTLGNRRVSQIVNRERGRAPAIQTKLKVGAADDRFEREANDVARRVMSHSEAFVAKRATGDDDPELLQRRAADA